MKDHNEISEIFPKLESHSILHPDTDSGNLVTNFLIQSPIKRKKRIKEKETNKTKLNKAKTLMLILW